MWAIASIFFFAILTGLVWGAIKFTRWMYPESFPKKDKK